MAKKLLGFVANGKVIEEMKNDRDNNPLHLAASLGKADMCEAMMGRGPELIECRNMDGETPLFLAALHGRKEAFYTLRQKWIDIKKEDVSIQHYKRNDGNSILHVTILGEYFGEQCNTPLSFYLYIYLSIFVLVIFFLCGYPSKYMM